MHGLAQLLVILLPLVRATDFPYGPHTPPAHSAFFQGWYTRVSGADNSSLAFVLGQHFPGDRPGHTQPEHPPVLCMVLVQPTHSTPGQPGSELQAYLRYFQELDVISSGPSQPSTDHGPSQPNGQEQDQSNTETGSNLDPSHSSHPSDEPTERDGSTADESGSSQGDGGSGVQPFTVITSGPALAGHSAHGHVTQEFTPRHGAMEAHGGMEAHGSGGAGVDGSFCRLSVDAGLVTLEAYIEGSVHLQLHSTGPAAAATPWSPHSASPEGWVGKLGPLVQVHYSTLSLATPVEYTLAMPRNISAQHTSLTGKLVNWIKRKLSTTDTPAESHALAAEQTDAADHKQPSSGIMVQDQGPLLSIAPAQDTQDSSPVQADEHARPGPGGEGGLLPGTEGWVRSEGMSGTAHLEAQYGRGFPPRWLWAQGHSMDARTGVTTSFVMAGGDLPHALSPPLPPLHTFLFSFRSGDLSVTVDPWNPAMPPLGGITERVDACAGTMNVELSSMTHVVQISISAPPDSFTPVACPSEHGFTTLSVESFIARASITIHKRSCIQRTAVRLQHCLIRVWRWLFDFLMRMSGRPRVTPSSRVIKPWLGAGELIVDTVITGAALEYGGHYRCRDTAGTQ